jgi:hypothetical protein
MIYQGLVVFDAALQVGQGFLSYLLGLILRIHSVCSEIQLRPRRSGLTPQNI